MASQKPTAPFITMAANQHRTLYKITLDEHSLKGATEMAELERQTAMQDVLSSNVFDPAWDNGRAGPFHLHLRLVDDRLIFEVTPKGQEQSHAVILAMKPFRRTVRDYFQICDAYFKAARGIMPERLEAVDMGRRGVHNTGADILIERLANKITLDHATARRLFTLICVLQVRGSPAAVRTFTTPH